MTDKSIVGAFCQSRSTALSFMVLGFGWGSFAALVPVLKAELQASDAGFGRLLLGSALGLLTAMWLAPRMDRRFKERAMPIAVVMLGLAFILPGIVGGNQVMFGLAMVVLGTASGLTDVIMNVRVSEREAATGRSLMNLNHAMFSVAYALAAIGTGLLRTAGAPPVLSFVGVAVFAGIASLWMRQPLPAQSSSVSTSTRFPVEIVCLGGGIVLVAFLIENATEVWSALHIERTLGGMAAEGSLGPAMLGLTMAFGRLGGQVVAQRLSEARVIICASGLAAVGLLIAATAAVPFGAYLGFAIAGLGVSVIAPMALALVGRMVPPDARSTAISRAAVIGFLGFFIGPPVLGAVSQAFGLRWALASVAMLLWIVPVLVLAMRPRHQPSSDLTPSR
ncbi:MFS transporter [Pseudoruegeria sp. SK021]|uniref:MFS transporter n=1 Tax=Pseudoruegeria sp. SK021 TaxID=1933035 RepID=UPI000A265E1C|nr:MFS transporter [Pseudoruegeria sp. SK021]OSP53683.1 MFS transporter [Pseudoruegeria sp. SK021]